MLKDLMAISGKPGLYKMVSQSRNGVIVESLETKKRIPAYATDKVSSLEDIAIYSADEEVPLKEVLKRIADKYENKEAVSSKSGNEDIKTAFEGVLPEYDKEKVYVSDMKKVFGWYNILQKLNMLDFTETEEDNKEELETNLQTEEQAVESTKKSKE